MTMTKPNRIRTISGTSKACRINIRFSFLIHLYLYASKDGFSSVSKHGAARESWAGRLPDGMIGTIKPPTRPRALMDLWTKQPGGDPFTTIHPQHNTDIIRVWVRANKA